ncbi:MAG: DeoR/GlpR family DNA-binding transcription regulator [bacterium]|nr:DeoR/GlpR family DNA-binding transcription regulator [bacterium]
MDSIAKINRKRKILDILEARGTLSINDLAEILGISPITLRKDLQDLEKQRLITRIWGGVALSTHPVTPEPPFEDRSVENLKEKRAIARVAITLVKPNDVIALGGGTTVYEFAKLLGGIPNVQVITNSVNIAYLLLRLGVRIAMPGGFSREGSYNLFGDRAEEFFRSVFIDKCFIGVDGIDVDGGLTTLNPSEADIYVSMINSAHTVIVLADHTKLGQKKLIPMSPINKVDVLITDELAPKEVIKEFEKKGVKVEIAPLELQIESYSHSEYKFK